MTYPITKFWFYPLCFFLTGEVEGREDIPPKGNFIIVSNHEHLIDPLLIIYPILKKLDKKVHFLSSARWWFLGDTICRKWAGCVPLFDKKQAYNESKNLSNSREIIAIFPEGGIKRTKNPKTGAVRLALETHIPILPIGLKSSYVPFKSTLNIGEMIYITKNKKNFKKQTEDLMKQVYKLRDGI